MGLNVIEIIFYIGATNFYNTSLVPARNSIIEIIFYIGATNFYNTSLVPARNSIIEIIFHIGATDCVSMEIYCHNRFYGVKCTTLAKIAA